MGNKPLENNDYDGGSKTNRSMVSTDSNKIITSMLQRVHTQMDNEQSNSMYLNDKSIIMRNPDNESLIEKKIFAETQQLFQNSSFDELGIENYFSANENPEIKAPSLPKSKQNSNSSPFTINNILKKHIPGKNVIIHQPKINCDFQQKLFNLPTDVFYLIVSFLIDNYNALTSVSPSWYYKINEIMEESLIDVDNDFIKKHMQCLSFKKSYFSITPLKLAKLGFRLDRNIVAEVFPCLEGEVKKFFYFNLNFINYSIRENCCLAILL